MNSQAMRSGAAGDNNMDMRNTLYLRKKRTEGYGMQLGWVLFVQGLSDQGIASSEGVKQGDTINKVWCSYDRFQLDFRLFEKKCFSVISAYFHASCFNHCLSNPIHLIKNT